MQINNIRSELGNSKTDPTYINEIKINSKKPTVP